MNTSRYTLLSAIPFTALASLVCIGLARSQDGPKFPLEPIGGLTTNLAPNATKPVLTWNITHPGDVTNLVSVGSSGTITINQNDIRIWVKAIGSKVSTGNGSLDESSTAAEASISYNGSSFQQLFYGSQLNMHPTHVLYAKTLKKNDTIDFGGRYVAANQWGPFHSTRSADRQVVALRHGDALPTSFKIHESPMLASHLKPYLDPSGKVNIGPFNLLVLMELGQTDRSHYSFDYQDMALLVTFQRGAGKHGHGDNLNGVNPSNPGGGAGGPTD